MLGALKMWMMMMMMSDFLGVLCCDWLGLGRRCTPEVGTVAISEPKGLRMDEMCFPEGNRNGVTGRGMKWLCQWVGWGGG